MNDHPKRWIADTPLLQFDHPRIRLLAMRLGQLKRSPREKAVACFAHIRSLPFGCIADSTGTSALSVLRARSAEQEPTAEALAAVRRELGLDVGPVALFGDWLGGALRGDLGRSWVGGGEVLPSVLSALGVSLALMGAALVVGGVAAIALG